MQKIIILAVLVLVFIRCKDNAERSEAAQKEAQKQEKIVNEIQNIWLFTIPNTTAQVDNATRNWKSWQRFKEDIVEKPGKSLRAYQLKSSTLALKVDSLPLNIPQVLNKTAVLSRISTLNTKIKSLETHLNVSVINIKKVEEIIESINEEIVGLNNQWNEIFIKQAIPKEIGEPMPLKDTLRNANLDYMKEKMLQADEKMEDNKPLVPTFLKSKSNTNKN